MKLLLYCTKSKPSLYSMNTVYDGKQLFDIVKGNKEMVEEKMNNLFCMNNLRKLNGKIVAECDFEVEKINVLDCTFRTFNLVEKEILNKSCLTRHELFEYLKNRFNPRGYAIHIKNLNIFDTPKDLSDYYTFDGKCEDINNLKPIKKAPQNMMYAYEYIDNFDWTELVNIINLNKNILISIQPQWLCKILNGEKTIEVRKKVLKEMLK